MVPGSSSSCTCSLRHGVDGGVVTWQQRPLPRLQLGALAEPKILQIKVKLREIPPWCLNTTHYTTSWARDRYDQIRTRSHVALLAGGCSAKTSDSARQARRRANQTSTGTSARMMARSERRAINSKPVAFHHSHSRFNSKLHHNTSKYRHSGPGPAATVLPQVQEAANNLPKAKLPLPPTSGSETDSEDLVDPEATPLAAPTQRQWQQPKQS